MPHDMREKTDALKTYYEKGLIYKAMNLPGPAINAFRESIVCKESSSYKSYFELSKLYTRLNDFDLAIKYCKEALQLKENYFQVQYYIAHLFKLQSLNMDDFISKIKAFFSPQENKLLTIADIFYMEGCYEAALEYIDKYFLTNSSSDSLAFLKTKCLVRSSKYDECIRYINTFSEDNPYFFKVMMYKLICLLVYGRKDSAWKVLNRLDKDRLSRYNKKVLSVYTQFFNLLTDASTSIISEHEYDTEYTSCIFEICDILLVNKEFDLLEKTLELLNLINDKTVLLQLGKLYFKYGYIELAKKEILRSIELFDIFDTEGLDILNY